MDTKCEGCDESEVYLKEYVSMTGILWFTLASQGILVQVANEFTFLLWDTLALAILWSLAYTTPEETSVSAIQILIWK